MDIFNVVAPLFLLIAVGAGLQRAGLIPPEVLTGINRLTYWVGLPVLVFMSLVEAERGEAAGAGTVIVVLLVTTLVVAALAWTFAVPAGAAPGARGTFVQASFRGNLAFVGLPLILSFPGLPRSAALLAVAPTMVVYNILSVAVLLGGRGESRSGLARVIGREIARNPIIVASLLGLVVRLVDLRLPVAAASTLNQLGRMAVPLALLCVGAALAANPSGGSRRTGVIAALAKAALSPLLAFALGRVFGLDAGLLLVAVIFASCPTAAVSYTMVRQLGGDERLAASAVLLSTFVSAAALGTAMALLAPSP